MRTPPCSHNTSLVLLPLPVLQVHGYETIAIEICHYLSKCFLTGAKEVIDGL